MGDLDVRLHEANKRIDNLEAELLDLRGRVLGLEDASGLFADDRDLDSQYGDETVKFSPRAWRGRDYKGLQLSRCEHQFLDAYASALQWMADNPKDEEKARYSKSNRRTAARARGWARRLRSGWSRSAGTAPPIGPGPQTALPMGSAPEPTAPPAPRLPYADPEHEDRFKDDDQIPLRPR